MLARAGNDQCFVPVVRAKRWVFVGRVVHDGSDGPGLGQYVHRLFHVARAESLGLVERRFFFRIELEYNAPNDIVLAAGGFGVALARPIPLAALVPTKRMAGELPDADCRRGGYSLAQPIRQHVGAIGEITNAGCGHRPSGAKRRI